jgi:hypothetical protein
MEQGPRGLREAEVHGPARGKDMLSPDPGRRNRGMRETPGGRRMARMTSKRRVLLLAARMADVSSAQSPGSVISCTIPGRGIPSGGVARRLQIPDLRAPRALPAGRRAPRLVQDITLPGDLAGVISTGASFRSISGAISGITDKQFIFRWIGRVTPALFTQSLHFGWLSSRRNTVNGDEDTSGRTANRYVYEGTEAGWAYSTLHDP